MEIAATLKTPASPRKKFLALGEQLLTGRVLLIVYVLASVGATVSKLILKDIVYHGVRAHQMIPLVVFRAAFFHLLHHQDIYANFPTDPDIFKYSPAFALFMAPFALLPYAAGAMGWNLLNGLGLFAGVWSIPRAGDRGKALILWFVLLRVVENLQNAQSDALVAGLMVGAWAAMEREKPLLSSFCIVASVFIKLFGALAVLPCLMICLAQPHWRSRVAKLFAYLAMWTAAFALAPAVVVGFRQLVFLYRSWYGRLQVDAANNAGLSVAGLLNHWHLAVPRLYVLAAGAAALLLVFLLRRDSYSDFRFRILAVASVLIFAVIFNHMSESTSMLIAATGAAVWYFLGTLSPGGNRKSSRESALAPQPLLDGLLAASVFLFTILWATAIIPGALRSRVMHGNLLIFSIPCMLVWLKVQYDLLRFPHNSTTRRA